MAETDEKRPRWREWLNELFPPELDADVVNGFAVGLFRRDLCKPSQKQQGMKREKRVLLVPHT